MFVVSKSSPILKTIYLLIVA
uniref:Uncharacterized protein n=1 Tax=Timema poppense TaxID=170557 RepID=A0A7R9HCQ7_TIMPO|nr:unnamed protein product [Timema poppensis]